MGSQAADALPELRALFEHNPPAVMQLAEDELGWRVALVRMGLPVSELAYPGYRTQQARDNEQRQVIAAVARYQPGQ
jgi:hypothetical protein